MSADVDSPLQAISFGIPARGLFGVYHSAGHTDPALPAVLLCNAFGQEAVRSHRLMRVLADRLARQGHPVLRFDYFGTGDSMGDDTDGDIEGWAGDVLRADAELRRLSARDSTLWFGIRLGASVALLAAQRAPPGLKRLLLFDAVIDGPAYLAHLRERHVRSLEAAFSLMPRPSPRELARDPAQFRDEAIGFAMSKALRAQLEAMTVAAHTWPPMPGSIVALIDPDGSDGRELAAIAGRPDSRIQLVVVKHGTDWTSDLADSTALVPTQALLAVLQHVGC